MTYRAFIFLILFVHSYFSLKAQEQSHEKAKIELVTGLKYATLDYIGGPLIGLNYHFNDDRSSISIRKDVTLALGTDQNSRSYYIDRYRTYSYLEYAYQLFVDLKLGIGAAWIYRGEDSVELLNKSSGYPAITTSLPYPIDFLQIEIRADIPLENDDIISKGHAFPLSIAMTLPLAYRR